MVDPDGEYADHPLYRALHDADMLEAMDVLGAWMHEIARSPVAAHPILALKTMEQMKPLVDGGYIEADVVIRGIAYAVELGTERNGL